MSDSLIPKIYEKVGELVGETKGIKEQLQRLNNRVSKNADGVVFCKGEIRGMKATATAWGAGAGIIITIAIEFLLKFLF